MEAGVPASGKRLTWRDSRDLQRPPDPQCPSRPKITHGPWPMRFQCCHAGATLVPCWQLHVVVWDHQKILPSWDPLFLLSTVYVEIRSWKGNSCISICCLNRENVSGDQWRSFPQPSSAQGPLSWRQITKQSRDSHIYLNKMLLRVIPLILIIHLHLTN